MKIKLLCDLPVKKQHGMTKARVLEVTLEVAPSERGRTGHGRERPYWYVMSDIGEGEEVGVLRHEAVIVEDD